MKILMPDYVYKNLIKYGNSALPNTKYSKQQLIKHLSYKMGYKVTIREAIFKRYNPKTYKTLETTYYVAEIL